MTSPFLTAKWLDLVLVTWRIDASILATAVPPGLEPDRRADDPEGVGYVSFVAFRFVDTRVLGVAVPLHTDFPEVNLRAYVREREGRRRRGVTFIAELVPKPAITAVANLVYHEHYRTVPMECEAHDTADGERSMSCRITLGDRVHALTIHGAKPPVVPPADSIEHFFKEHEWGFGRDGSGDTLAYRVEHPVWAVYPTALDRLELRVGFAELYGPPWEALDGRAPDHVAFAVGSEIAVFPKG